MAKDKLPALQFYTGDWRKDPGVQALTLEEKGAWMEVLIAMHESNQRGRLVLNGSAMPDAGVANILGIDEAKWKQIKSKLVAYGVAKVDDGGVLYSKRMCEDEAIRQKRSAAGRKGGKKSKPKQSGSKP